MKYNNRRTMRNEIVTKRYAKSQAVVTNLISNIERATAVMLALITAIAVMDLVGYMAWVVSGQAMPTDSYYIGAITNQIVTAIF